MKTNQKTFALWFALVVLTIFMFRAWDIKHQKAITDFNYSKLLRAAELKEIVEDKVVFVQDRGEIRGEIKPEFEKKYGGLQFQIPGNISDKGFEEMQKFGITPNYETSQSDGLLSSIVINWLPL